MNKSLKVLLTGASGAMGQATLEALARLEIPITVTALTLDTPADRKALQSLRNAMDLRIIWGDLTSYHDCLAAVKGQDVILHLAAFTSPQADLKPQLAMRINYGGTLNLLRAVIELEQNEQTRFIYIGTVAETGDRMAPIHWGRVGDPIKPAIYDYYAVSKTAAERAVVESGLRYWSVLRQTGMIGKAMTRIFSPIILHNPLANVLEYVSDRDSGQLMATICQLSAADEMPPEFNHHIFNIGGGKSCRVDTLSMYQRVFADTGVTRLNAALNGKIIATGNFHGQYFLDSDKLEKLFQFQHDSIEYFYRCYRERLGQLTKLAKIAKKSKIVEQLMVFAVRQSFNWISRMPGGTRRGIRKEGQSYIAAFWGSIAKWRKQRSDCGLPPDFKPVDYSKIINIDHGYDEDKNENELDIYDLKHAASYRGGALITSEMITGDWQTKLRWCCAFGHYFDASPRLILQGGHWCPNCEDQSWNYAERAKRDEFFAQVWDPLHDKDDLEFEYPKLVKPQAANLKNLTTDSHLLAAI